MITISGLNKLYKTSHGTVPVLRNINLQIEKGDIFGIIGLSGAGKSTLIRCLKPGAKIAIPNNPSNEYRALALLEKQGLIKLKPGISNFQATAKDIIENTNKLKLVEVDAAQLTRGADILRTFGD